MQEFNLRGTSVSVRYVPSAAFVSVEDANGNVLWRSRDYDPYLLSKEHGQLSFSSANLIVMLGIRLVIIDLD